MDVCPSARKFLDEQIYSVRLTLLDNVQWLESNPHLTPDDKRKRPFDVPPVVLRLYRDDTHWIVYYIEHGTLIIANIGDAAETPHLWRH